MAKIVVPLVCQSQQSWLKPRRRWIIPLDMPPRPINPLRDPKRRAQFWALVDELLKQLGKTRQQLFDELYLSSRDRRDLQKGILSFRSRPKVLSRMVDLLRAKGDVRRNLFAWNDFDVDLVDATSGIYAAIEKQLAGLSAQLESLTAATSESDVVHRVWSGLITVPIDDFERGLARLETLYELVHGRAGKPFESLRGFILQFMLLVEVRRHWPHLDYSTMAAPDGTPPSFEQVERLLNLARAKGPESGQQVLAIADRYMARLDPARGDFVARSQPQVAFFMDCMTVAACALAAVHGTDRAAIGAGISNRAGRMAADGHWTD